MNLRFLRAKTPGLRRPLKPFRDALGSFAIEGTFARPKQCFPPPPTLSGITLGRRLMFSS